MGAGRNHRKVQTMNQQIINIPFHGDKLRIVETDTGTFVAVRPICEALGADWSAQLKRLKGREKVFCVAVFAIQHPSGAKETTCIPVNRLALWLANLNPKTVSEEHRAKLELYQVEAADVLDRHFRLKERRIAAQNEALIAVLLSQHQRWAKIYFMYQAGVAREMVFRQVRRSFADTLADIEQMEALGIIDRMEWGEEDTPGRVAMLVDPAVQKAFRDGYVRPDGDARFPIARRYKYLDDDGES